VQVSRENVEFHVRSENVEFHVRYNRRAVKTCILSSAILLHYLV
jgi:hypothetical protein